MTSTPPARSAADPNTLALPIQRIVARLDPDLPVSDVQTMEQLVGASTMYIALPFLLEALVTAVIGVGLAAGALGAFMYFGVHQRIADSISFMPWIGLDEYLNALIVIAILGPLLTLLPTLLLTRKYLKV